MSAPNWGRPWTDKDQEQLAALVTAGRTRAEIGAEIGRTAGAVSMQMSATRLLTGRKSWWTEERCERLGYLWGLGWPVRDIAADLGTTKNAVIGKAMRCGLEYHRLAAQFNPHLKSAA